MGVTIEDLRRLIREEIGQKSVKSNDEDASVHIQNCPDCYKKGIQAMNAKSEYFCEKCGLPLGNENFARALESCPNCSNTTLRKVKE